MRKEEEEEKTTDEQSRWGLVTDKCPARMTRNEVEIRDRFFAFLDLQRITKRLTIYFEPSSQNQQY